MLVSNPSTFLAWALLFDVSKRGTKPLFHSTFVAYTLGFARCEL